MNTKRTLLSQQQLEALIRKESLDSFKVFFTPHVQQRMRQRGITHASILQTLQNGRIKKKPEPNTMKGSVECRMEHFSAGHNISVVVAVCDDDPTLILVTAF